MWCSALCSRAHSRTASTWLAHAAKPSCLWGADKCFVVASVRSLNFQRRHRKIRHSRITRSKLVNSRTPPLQKQDAISYILEVCLRLVIRYKSYERDLVSDYDKSGCRSVP